MKKILTIICSALISLTTLGQTTWYEIPTGTTKKLNAIDFPTNTVGYIVGNDSTILKTIDGGLTWEQLGLNGIDIIGPSDDFYDVDFVDADTGFITSSYSGLYKTVDGGQNWTQLFGQSSSMCYYHTVHSFSGDNFFSGGAGCFEGAIIEHFEMSSSTTSAIDTQFWDNQIRVQAFSFVNPTVGLAATKSEIMLRTIDGGATWDTISTGIDGFLTSVVMVDELICFAGYDEMGGGFGILKSIDGGLTWEQDINSATFYYPAYLSVHAAQNGDIYSGAVPSNSPGGLIFESTDLANWEYYTVDQPINDMTSYGSDITFGVGDSGYLVVNTPILELSTYEHDLIQFEVYPNPVNDKFTVKNPNSVSLELMILDASGRIIKRELIGPGLSSISTEQLTQGIYFVKVISANQFGLKRILKE